MENSNPELVSAAINPVTPKNKRFRSEFSIPMVIPITIRMETECQELRRPHGSVFAGSLVCRRAD
jgi:hypothetical protein